MATATTTPPMRSSSSDSNWSAIIPTALRFSPERRQNASPTNLLAEFFQHSPKQTPSQVRSPGNSPVLQLVPKELAKLSALGKSGEAMAKMIDPQPEWTLDSLKEELLAISDKLVPRDLHGGPHTVILKQPAQSRTVQQPLKDPQGFSCRELSPVVDFARTSRPFVMNLDDLDSDDEDPSSSEEDEKLVKCPESTANSCSTYTVSVNGSARQTQAENVRMRTDHNFMMTRTGTMEAALFEADRARLLRVQEELRQRQSHLETAMLEEAQNAAAKLAQVLKDEEAKCEMARRSDKQYQRSIAEARDKYLSALQRDHEQRSQVEERKIREEVATEEARKRAREERQAQLLAAEKKKADALLQAQKEAEVQRKKQAEAAAAAAAAAAQRAEAAAKQDEAERIAKQDAVQNARKGDPVPKVSLAAAEREAQRMKIWKNLDEACKPLWSNPALKKDLRSLEHLITKTISQISATEEQVRRKSAELVQMLTDPRKPQEFVLMTIASKLMSQCETQVSKVRSFANTLAQIIVNVSKQVPVFMDVVFAKLHLDCIFTVPKHYLYSKTDYEDEKAYLRVLGYREEDGKIEAADDYMSRMTAYITLQAAITQTSGDVSSGWKWCAQLLNELPANQYTASALHAYLEAAGFRLYRAYPKPFVILMKTIAVKFIPNLNKLNDSDVMAAVNRLETYIWTEAFKKQPETRLNRETYSTIVFRDG